MRRQGMSNFATWVPDGLPQGIESPTDADAWWHDSETNEHLVLEFKRNRKHLFRAQRLLLEGLAAKPGILVLAVNEGLTTQCGKLAKERLEDHELIEIAAPPNWQWRVQTVGFMRKLVSRWAWVESRTWARECIRRLGQSREPDMAMVRERLSRHGWEGVDAQWPDESKPLRKVPHLADREDQRGSDPQPGEPVAEDLQTAIFGGP